MSQNINGAIYVKKVQTSREFKEIQGQWNSFLSESTTDDFFLRWEWLWSWWKEYANHKYKLCIFMVFMENELIGIAPFYILDCSWRGIFRFRRLMFLGTCEGSVISEYMDLIYKNGCEKEVVKSILELVENENMCDDILLQNVKTTSKILPMFQDIANQLKYSHLIRNKVECPFIKLPATYEDYFKGLSCSMRYSIRRKTRRLNEYDKIRFRKTENISQFDKDYDELVRLHQLRWESRGMAGSFSSGNFEKFQNVVMKEMLKSGNLELWFLSVSGRNIAALYNIRYKEKIYYFQSGLDSSFDNRLSPGLILHNYCIEVAVKNGLKEYDFMLLGKTDFYKKQWTKEFRYLCDFYMARQGILKQVVKTKKIFNDYLTTDYFN